MKFQSFKDMSIAPVLMGALGKMSISKPTPIQSQAIPLGLEGADMIAIAQTGSGKTLAYALSLLTALSKKPEARALVLAPSREMAQQIYDVFLKLCADMPVSACLAVGGTTGAKQSNQLKKNPRLIIATPGRLNDHLSTNKMLLQNVEVVVIDEADRMLDMGFAPQLKTIHQTLRGRRQTMMFSASFGKNVESIARLFMSPKVAMIRSEKAEAPVSSLKQKVLLMDKAMKQDRLLDELNATKGGVIVFTGSQESCETVGNYLKEYGYSTDLIHGGLSQGQRNRVVRDLRGGELRVVVATDLLARGIDIPHVDHVINFDLPFQTEDFLHRIGRTARAGRAGHAITFVAPSDTRMYNKIKPYLQGAEEIKLDPKFEFFKARPKKEIPRPPSRTRRPY
jgi:ATP-dependent RNA helicase RhlE